MDHAINSLKAHLYAEISFYHDGVTTKEELQVYVEAINVLEKHLFGEVQTVLENLI
ncbi:hypothetical protein SH601_05550 [Gracilibacillus sp. S3-1-1]|uniref:Uncharacterized protein n=1 Tax=Gracilibacillus pellucidus TaxID=3095368 RepID=A0ACC6M3B1_9BACI|nr:hypothetical protein [Gracilibacillus sp. S3-1-1]MDX8045450.1 hypothetical protein [Gracilibacillus sp. S3-1-1]